MMQGIVGFCGAIVALAGCLVWYGVWRCHRWERGYPTALPTDVNQYTNVEDVLRVLEPEIKRVKISHLAAVTEDGEELGDVWLGPHNMTRRAFRLDDDNSRGACRAENHESIKIYIKKDGVAFGSVYVDFDGNQYGVGQFPEGSQEVKKGEYLEFLPGRLRLGVPGAGGDKNIRFILW